MKSKSWKALEILTVAGSAVLFFILSYLTAKWLILDASLVSHTPMVNNDLLVGAMTFLAGGVPAAIILSLFDKRSGIRLALIVAPLALFFMALHGFLFILLIQVPYWLYGLLVYGGFVGLVGLLGAVIRRFCADSCRYNVLK